MNGKKQTSYRYLKKGSRNKSDIYRPASLTSVICKLLKRLFKDDMVDFLVKHNLIYSSQYGFQQRRSCFTNMFLEEITKWIEEESPVDVYRKKDIDTHT